MVTLINGIKHILLGGIRPPLLDGGYDGVSNRRHGLILECASVLLAHNQPVGRVWKALLENKGDNGLGCKVGNRDRAAIILRECNYGIQIRLHGPCDVRSRCYCLDSCRNHVIGVVHVDCFIGSTRWKGVKMTTASPLIFEAGTFRSSEMNSTRPCLTELADRLPELLFKTLEGLAFHEFIPESFGWPPEMIEQVLLEGVDLVQWKFVKESL